jgi:hypothetical protein
MLQLNLSIGSKTIRREVTQDTHKNCNTVRLTFQDKEKHVKETSTTYVNTVS